MFNFHLTTRCEQVEILLQHVVRGEETEAESLLQIDPELLLESGIVRDYSNRIIFGTALQIAAGAEDVRYQQNEKCMAEMIQRYWKRLSKGDVKIATQIQKQYPEGYAIQEETRIVNDSEALHKVIDAIANAALGDDCEAALQAFRKYLQPNVVFKTGRHFNTYLLIQAFKLYDDNYSRFGGWDSEKNNLCWRKVIGYIQRFLPACYAQAFCQGIHYIVEEDEPLSRCLRFRDNNKAVFFPLDSDPRFRLGYDFAVDEYGRALASARPMATRHRLFYQLCQEKNINVVELMQAPKISKHSHKVM